MGKSTTDLRSIAAAGGGMIIDAENYSTTDLRSIASAASNKQAQIVITNAGKKSTTDLRSIAAAGNGCVVFDFS
ncbi:hypothetical protein [Thioalkalivibrio thiocyanodenitrificans]|uniref:hypothetical protein n=1 Tax=Thioalkalivibrio thiocyanodenitrificans TaxID=243063 RepID=UPI0012EA71AF|nr:hypothetical protein [Thioalkalivibrio thiocyanodenitrificans]